MLFGYGQGLVMPQLFNIVLRSVAHGRAGSASGVIATTQQVANAIGIAWANSESRSIIRHPLVEAKNYSSSVNPTRNVTW
jgi:hypothetical protein